MSSDLQVLLVEDSQLIAARMMELIANTAGVAAVGAVTTETEAIASVNTLHPDVVILDLLLKQGTGFGVLQYLKSLANPPKVVVVTNYALPQYQQRAMRLGASYFLDKNLEFDRIPEILHSLQQQHPA